MAPLSRTASDLVDALWLAGVAVGSALAASVLDEQKIVSADNDARIAQDALRSYIADREAREKDNEPA